MQVWPGLAPGQRWSVGRKREVVPGDVGIALVGFVLLTAWQTPPLVVVAISALGGITLALGAS